MDLARCSLNSITVRGLGLIDLIGLAADNGIPAVAPWRDIVEAVGATKASRTIKAAGLRVSSLCRGGMFTAETREGRRAALDDNRRAIEDAHTLEAAVLVVVCGPLIGRDTAGSRQMVLDGLSALVDDATAAGVRLGVEPLHPMMISDRSVITSLAEANELVDRIGSPAVGVVVDAYHVWWDVSVEREIARAGDRIMGFHVSDWTIPINGQLSSRGMIGDGCIDLPRLSRAVEQAGYRGDVEIEILSDELWQQRPSEILHTVRERFVRYV